MQRRGTVLIITMIISFALAGTVLVLCRSMRVETMASANLAASLQASAVARGAERYVLAVLTEQPDDINNIAEDQFEAVPVGEGFFWIMRPDFDDPNAPVYGIVDENAKLNINSASFDSLSLLPGMTYTAASAIMDWKDDDSRLERDGAESEYYLSQPEPYYCKDSNFETVEELLEVRGVDRLMLYGDGTAPPLGQRSSIFRAGMGMNDPQLSRGIYDLLTVYSAESNRTADGQARINVNVSRGDRPRMRAQLQRRLEQRLDKNRAAQIVSLVGDNRLHDIFEMYFRCKLKPDEMDLIADDITSSTNSVIRRININTAPRSVLQTITSLDEEDVDKLISARSSNSTGYAWVAEALKEKSINLGEVITNRSYQYSADILATSGNGRAFKRVRIVIDTRSGAPQIIYRRDLTQRGWPMEPQVLAALRSGQFAGNGRGMTIMGAAQ